MINPQASKAFLRIAMGLWVVAVSMLWLRRSRTAEGVFAAGFLCAVLAVVAQWRQAAHVPLQSMYEVFLCLSALAYPLSLLWRRVLGAGGRSTDLLLSITVAVPAAFVFDATPQPLPPALQSPFFIPHVSAYLVAYVVLFKAGMLAVPELIRRARTSEPAEAELIRYRLVRLGLPLMTLGLVLGSAWGKMAWGHYWNWDPKELWSLATWLVFVAYVHARGVWGEQHPRLMGAFLLMGNLAIVLTLLWVNLAPRLFQGLHTYSMPG